MKPFVIARQQWAVIILAFAQEILFNAYGLLPNNYVGQQGTGRFLFEVYDSSITDRWVYHLVGNQLGLLLLVGAFLFIERTARTVPLFAAWFVYMLVQVIQSIWYGNSQDTDLIPDAVLLIALFWLALFAARYPDIQRDMDTETIETVANNRELIHYLIAALTVMGSVVAALWLDGKKLRRLYMAQTKDFVVNTASMTRALERNTEAMKESSRVIEENTEATKSTSQEMRELMIRLLGNPPSFLHKRHP